MRRNVTTYRGRFFDYWLEEFSAYPYTRWTWRYGIMYVQRGRHCRTITGTSATRPDPAKVFPNLLTK